jgi:hypothetical protein
MKVVALTESITYDQQATDALDKSAKNVDVDGNFPFHDMTSNKVEKMPMNSTPLRTR